MGTSAHYRKKLWRCCAVVAALLCSTATGTAATPGALGIDLQLTAGLRAHATGEPGSGHYLFALTPALHIGVYNRESTADVQFLHIEAGGRSHTARWRLHLLHTTAAIAFTRPDSAASGGLHEMMIYADATVVDYNRAARTDLYARWLAVAGGLGLRSGRETTVEPRVYAGIGIASFRLGSVNYSTFGSDAETLYSGLETTVGGAVSVHRGPALSATGSLELRSVFSSLTPLFLSYGIALTAVPVADDTGRPLLRCTAGIEREHTAAAHHSQVLIEVYGGIQWTFR